MADFDNFLMNSTPIAIALGKCPNGQFHRAILKIAPCDDPYCPCAISGFMQMACKSQIAALKMAYAHKTRRKLLKRERKK